MTTMIDGTRIARRIRAQVAAEVAAATGAGAIPGLATVLVGDDPASAVYVAAKRRAIGEAGMRDFHRHLSAHATQDEVAAVIDELAADPQVSGILLQLPLPGRLDAVALIDRIPVTKDVDGLTTASAGLLARGERGLRPCTPSGVVELLDAEGVRLKSAHVAVVGWGELVGRPLTQLLLRRGATVSVAHEFTTDLAAVTRPADIVVVATGVRGLIGPEHVSPGAVVIDVGIHRTPSGLTGDVRSAELDGIAGRITPVPGGVGPMTIAMLMVNTLLAARWSAEREDVVAQEASGMSGMSGNSPAA
ncbi:bifunctional 5,10-methylenetetrahydrofolate dehydrogenase/5,10-methenyltetrahydrofolate cyclohydrolase [Streptomyces prunicolor]|uniref:bifunctional 5,10-methylenetetrahydrofolate dehydrogenase/5,10-methenyltetrahydrofolate cyclohydrolase n=1 Tax=Streptomyces prunicolor TaxID=67348 RepID=UPI00225841AB|nr:bifunctional 5,10-methylenetetrahydrofolate dehydrogenase/5,10-methenyltetrahydrofolate cyclohydrolase [Streptomyces prunicolor]MCX5241005.1 bifunctional 5,10-methylenetetrahydrofolate dehydrogenase/5,10-methenyltetrahydrofolate cyclohydrolase [Streptomyces prunicolor]